MTMTSRQRFVLGMLFASLMACVLLSIVTLLLVNTLIGSGGLLDFIGVRPY